MRAPWAGVALAAATVAAGTLPAAAEVCSASSVPEVRYCLDDEFCCWRGCCTRSMLYFFKLSVAVVLIVMVLVWLCNYLRRGRSQPECPPGGVRPRTHQPPPAFVPRAHAHAHPHVHSHARSPYAAQPPPPQPPPPLPAPAPANAHPPPHPDDDLPPPYHAVVNMPPAVFAPTQLPSYDASCKASTGPA